VDWLEEEEGVMLLDVLKETSPLINGVEELLMWEHG